MSTPRKRLPVKPSAEHLRKQAKHRHKLAPEKPLAEHQHALATEYGCKSWAQLMHMVETMLRGASEYNVKKPIREPLPDAANSKDIDRVRAILVSGEFTQHDLDLALARCLGNMQEQRPIAELLIEHGADVDGQYGSDYGPIVLVCGECLSPEGFEFMIANGCDVTFAPVKSKYGPASPMLHTLYTYGRSSTDNVRKYRCIEILERNGAWIPPETEVTPAMWAIHKGDAQALAMLVDANPHLLRETFPQMREGNLLLQGATLLHMATDYSEIACIDVLLDRGADINARADIINGVGGQTPIFHAANHWPVWKTPVLSHLIKRAGQKMDTTLATTVKRGNECIGPVTVMELMKDEPEVLALLHVIPGLSQPEAAIPKR